MSVLFFFCKLFGLGDSFPSCYSVSILFVLYTLWSSARLCIGRRSEPYSSTLPPSRMSTTTPAAVTRHPKLSKMKCWSDHKDTIIRLYKTENLTLPQVKDIMLREYEFAAS